MQTRSIFPYWIAFVLFTALFYPGFVNSDSQTQYQQAFFHNYSDWHPPLMSLIWHYLMKLIPHSGGMHLFYCLLFWIGLYYLRLGILSTLLIAFSPMMVVAFAGVVKDTLFIAALLFSYGMILAWREQRRLYFLFFFFLGAVLTVGTRHNGAPVLFPLGYMLFYPYRGFSWKRLAFTTTFFFMVIGVEKGIEKKIIKPSSVYLETGTMIHDLVAISFMQNTQLLPESYLKTRHPGMFFLNNLKDIFIPENCIPLFWNQKGYDFMVHADSERDAVWKSWFQAVKKYPGSYLKQRWNQTMAHLGLRPQVMTYWVQYPSFYRNHHSEIEKIQRSYLSFPHSPYHFLLQSWFYWVWIIGIGIVGWLWGVSLPIPLALGVFLYELTYVILSGAGNFRYSWPVVLVALIFSVQVFSFMVTGVVTVIARFRRDRGNRVVLSSLRAQRKLGVAIPSFK